MKIAELKQISSRPDVVEVKMFDCDFLHLQNLHFCHYLFIHMLDLYLSCICFQVWDATAADPKLLVFLKSYRNTVPVPRHWCQKRKFLQVSSPLWNWRLVGWNEHTWLINKVNMWGLGNRGWKITPIRFLLYVYMWFLQGSCCDNQGARTCRCLAMGTLIWFPFLCIH